ncbi:MAG: xylulokinase [Anaerolineaceae bacterium]|nr:MAG: xylulokinase [Anaerolineaceae bacterium]
MSYILAIDIGTSSAKTVLFDASIAQIIAEASHEYPIHKPTPERAEQNPDDWWAAVVYTTQQVMATSAVNPADIAAIGLTGQMHGTVLIDANHQPIHPAIIWADQRSAEQVEQLTATLGTENYVAIAGTLPAAGFMGATLLWLYQHTDLLELTHYVIFPKDYIRLRLTGETATEISDAAASGIFDVRAQSWSERIIKAAGLPDHIFPTILGSTDIAGTLTMSAAAALGLRSGTPVVAGCADQPAQAIANGLIVPGRASVTTGSGGQVFAPLSLADDAPLPVDPRLHVLNHAVPDSAYILGAMLSAGLALRWLRGITGLSGVPDAYAILSASAATVRPGADGLIFLPYLTGERTPHMNPSARGVFFGLSDYHGRGHLARAVMEGVAFALRQILEITLPLSGDVETIIATGGGAESDVWRGIQADVFGLPLQKSLLREQTCIGAAVLAGVGTGVYASLDQACESVRRYGAVTAPVADHHAAYQPIYDRFLRLYPLLKNEMGEQIIHD